MEVLHITFYRSALEPWLTKGGEIRGKLNGIGFAQTLNIEVDNAQHSVVCDISLQATRLALPGTTQDSMPEEIKQQLETLENDWRQQHTRFSEQQHCMFIHRARLGRIEARL
ncbi:hypothetical protein CR082_25505, partial [Salmonella enterica subsp. enterica serovar Typhimurium]|uniref:ATPase RavA domain-containing protein n=1 Tax=Salmonella enterica TaxID=28901 RepID=UPI000C01F9AE